MKHETEKMKHNRDEEQDVREKIFSYELEKGYYCQRWPDKAKPYLYLEPYLRCWLDADKVFAGKRVLDIGAGECTYTRLIADRFGPAEVVACELFRERMLPAALENQNPILRFIVGDCFRLPFQSGSFEVVFGSLVLCQLPGLGAAVGEISRVLSSDGLYVGIEPNPFHPVHFYRYVRRGHSPNQYLFGPRHLTIFKNVGFDVTLRYFYAKLPFIRNRLLGPCMGILARLSGKEG